ncbi:MAG: hypothetical protein EXQ52_10535 [Bryobacterales bacterium]|nr:hypothetical protein [Bryobacterales bacterium]
MIRAVLVAFMISMKLHAGRALLECTADTSADLVRKTASGKARELRVGGKGRVVLLDFRTAVIEGWIVEKATLLLHIASGAVPLKLEIAAAPFPWSESETGAHALGATKFHAFDVRESKFGWIEIDASPALLRGRGLILRAPGKTETTLHSRETVQYSPYLIVEGSK